MIGFLVFQMSYQRCCASKAPPGEGVTSSSPNVPPPGRPVRPLLSPSDMASHPKGAFREMMSPRNPLTFLLSPLDKVFYLNELTRS